MSSKPTEIEDAEPGSFRLRAGVILSGRWRLEAPIGAGGMGEVWRATHVQLGRAAAVKVLTVPSPANRARMLREARILAGIRHPALIEVFDVGDHDGVPWFVMPWLESETLAQRVARTGPMEPEQVIPLILPVVAGLGVAHRAGFIHRDVKPDNVLWTRDGGAERLVLIDFGIARAHGAVDGRITRTGALVGTPEYMAPEVLRGQDADARADVWGICLTALEAIAGTSPFRRDDFVATVRAVVDDAPTTWPPSVDVVLRSILQRGLAKEVSRRFATADQLHGALAAWWTAVRESHHARTEPPPSPAPPPRSGERRRGPAAEPTRDDAAPASLDALIQARFGTED
jgi:serine/threonine protein kinase